MTRKLLVAVLFSLLLINAALAHSVDTDRIAATLETLRQSVNAHDFTPLEPLLADDFSYQGSDAQLSQMIMRQVIAGYPTEITAINITSISMTDDGWLVGVSLVRANDTEQRSIRLSDNYRVQQADIADIQLAGHGAAAPTAETTTADSPAVTAIPFSLAKNLIVVEAEINGVFGNYLVDTGAQSIVLNSAHFETDDVETVAMNHARPAGVNGEILDVQGAVKLRLSWGAIEISGLRGIVMDLTHLEKSVGVKVLGLIGYNVLERFQIQFDYAARELTLFSLDDDAQPLVQSDLGQPTLVASLDMAGHIPVVDVEIAGHELRVGVDSGAGEDMLFERWQAVLDGEYEFIERTELRGGDKNVQMGDVVRLANIRLQDLDYPEVMIRFNDVAGFSGSSDAMPMDGLLGYQFLKAHPTAINFRARKLLVWSPSGS